MLIAYQPARQPVLNYAAIPSFTTLMNAKAMIGNDEAKNNLGYLYEYGAATLVNYTVSSLF